jgi:hypothetical protein
MRGTMAEVGLRLHVPRESCKGKVILGGLSDRNRVAGWGEGGGGKPLRVNTAAEPLIARIGWPKGSAEARGNRAAKY